MMFNKWCESLENVPCMKEMNTKMLNYWLQRFVLGRRKQDGSEYLPYTLYFIVGGLLYCVICERKTFTIFLNMTAVYRKVLDGRMKKLLSKSLVGTKV